jgi:crossover junction endodeoxyribonuclease RuvC
MTTVIGIDPGLAATGFGIVRSEAGRLVCLDFGVIRTDPALSSGERLLTIHSGIGDLVSRFLPVRAGIESLYFTRNVTSAIPVAQARGVVLLAMAQHSIPAEEYTPQQIKQAVVGNGNADKEQVMQMVRVVLGMTSVPRPDHAADALAAAITRLHDTLGR